MSTTSARGLVRWSTGADGTVLVCFPWAGGGAGVFRDWPDALPDSVDVWAARLRGRESRIGERAAVGVDEVVDEFVGLIDGTFSGREVVLFGHCVGALVAFELAHALTDAGCTRVLQLLVASQPAPRLRVPPRDGTDAIEELRRRRMLDDELLAQPELLELLRPAIEADVELAESFRTRTRRPLEVPIVAFRGRRDVAVARPAVADWAAETADRFEFVELDGDHLFSGADRVTFLTAVGDRIRDVVR